MTDHSIAERDGDFLSWEVPSLVDPHGHLREDKKEEKVVGPLIERATEGGATVVGTMSNTEKGLLTAADVLSYNKKAVSQVPPGTRMTFIPFLQITEETSHAIIDGCVEAGIRDAKVYPRDRTTKSHIGVRRYGRLIDLVCYAGIRGMRVHFHPEHPSLLFENRDAEYVFVPIVDIMMQETDATIIWEHATDARCIPWWKDWAETGRFFITVTGHHLVANESSTYGDVQAICKPPYKTERDRMDIGDLVMEDHNWVMAGGDSAAHPKGKKHVYGPCACGAFTAPFLLPLYAHGLDRLLQSEEGVAIFVRFTSGNARALYQLPESATHPVTLARQPQIIPHQYQIGPWVVEPFWAGRSLLWSLAQGRG